MAAHPVRVHVTDDLHRSRLTVFFRLLLAIPHFIWVFLWTVIAGVAAVVNWIATLILGRSPELLHRFLAAYIAYQIQLRAYLALAANPYPAFDGSPGYPVDVDIPPPQPQSRWTVVVRLLLALPALILTTLFFGFPFAGASRRGRRRNSGGGGGGVLGGLSFTVAFLAWFACLARGEMPRGFRDLQTYQLRYGAQAWAYAFLLTDRYPDTDTAEPRGPQEPPSHPITLRVDDDLRRSRLTVFFRLLLSIPHLVWLGLWWIAAVVIAIPVWFIVLATGRLPASLHRFYAAFIRYGTHVGAFLYLAANPFPGFVGQPGYPTEVEIGGPERQNRWITGFRIILVIPAFMVAAPLGSVAFVAAVFGWFVSLFLGRMPLGLRNFIAFAVRYSAQVYAYVLLLTDRYPDSGPRQHEPAEEDAAELVPAV